MQYQAIKTTRYLDISEIYEHLQNVSHIIMAAPAPEKFQQTPLHLSLFLNTQEALPQQIHEAVLDKFCDEHAIKNPSEVLAQLMSVGFGMSTQETPMPMLLVKPQDRATIPNIPMFVIDFLADSDQFDEVKTKQLTGWSYIYG